MALRARRGGGNGLDAWPGYVDALSTLLMVVMFVLLVFVLAQALQAVMLAKRNEQLGSVSQTLGLEQQQNAKLRGSVAAGDRARAALLTQLRDLNTQTANTMAERDKLAALLKEVEIAVAAAATINAGLSARVDAAARTNAGLTGDLAEKSSENARLRGEAAAAARGNERLTADNARLQNEIAAAEQRMLEMRRQMAALDRTVQADKATIDAKLSDLARLMEQAAALTALRDVLDKQVKTAAAAALTEEQRRRAIELQLRDEKQLGDSTKAKIALLTQQVEQLRGQLSASEQRRADEQNRASGLTEQLNLALAAQVEELRKYRSDFFGKLRKVLADRPGVTIAGDRFVFQSEVLFGISSAELTQAGMAQMADLAATFRNIVEEIPPDVNWVLRVDGHTDAVPIHSPRFASNWELSSARAITVVKFLTTQGIPARHLAATGFGDNQPLDPAETPEAYAKNRRIELRLTDR